MKNLDIIGLFLMLLVIVLMFLVALFNVPVANAETKVLTSPKTIQLITKYALEYDVDALQMWRTIKCESGFNEKAIGDGGRSYGLSQIHLPSHPYVTKAQAFDAEFSIEFMAKKFSENKQKIWTCYRILRLET